MDAAHAQWPLINTAPKDGSLILLASAGSDPSVSYWKKKPNGDGEWISQNWSTPYDGEWGYTVAPTHWHPLPEGAPR